MKPFFPPVAYVLVFFSCLFVSCFVFLRRITPFFFYSFTISLHVLLEPSLLPPLSTGFPCPVCPHCPSTIFHPSVTTSPPHFISVSSFPALSLLSLCVPCLCNPRPQLLSLCVFVPLSPVLPPMVGCVSCVWMRPRKRSARPWGSSCSRRWSCSMPTRARSRCRPRHSMSVSSRSWSRRCHCAEHTWNKRCCEINTLF